MTQNWDQNLDTCYFTPFMNIRVLSIAYTFSPTKCLPKKISRVHSALSANRLREKIFFFLKLWKFVENWGRAPGPNNSEVWTRSISSTNPPKMGTIRLTVRPQKIWNFFSRHTCYLKIPMKKGIRQKTRGT